MRNRLIFAGIFLIWVAILALVAIWKRPSKVPEATLVNFSRLHVGMTNKEINSILGEPREVIQGSLYMHHYYGEHIVIYFGLNSSDDTAVQGMFKDEDDAVPLAEKSMSILDRIRQWIGWPRASTP